MTIKSIMQEALNTASTYGQSALDKAKWGFRYVSDGFNTHVAPRVSLLFSNGLQRLQSLPQSTRAFVATPVGKGAIGASLLGVLGFVFYVQRRHSQAKEAEAAKITAEEANKKLEAAKATEATDAIKTVEIVKSFEATALSEQEESTKKKNEEKVRSDKELGEAIKNEENQKVLFSVAWKEKFSKITDPVERQRVDEAYTAQGDSLPQARNKVVELLIAKLKKEDPKTFAEIEEAKNAKDKALEHLNEAKKRYPLNDKGYAVWQADGVIIGHLQEKYNDAVFEFYKLFDDQIKRFKETI